MDEKLTVKVTGNIGKSTLLDAIKEALEDESYEVVAERPNEHAVIVRRIPPVVRERMKKLDEYHRLPWWAFRRKAWYEGFIQACQKIEDEQ